MSVDLLAPLRTAIIDPVNGMADDLSLWKNEPACFTRRPVPRDAKYPLAIINPPTDISNEDALSTFREVQIYRIAFYGKKADPGAPDDQTRIIEALGHRAHEFFHRNKWAIQGAGFRIIDIVASGPIAGPADDDETVGRIVTLRLRLGRT